MIQRTFDLVDGRSLTIHIPETLSDLPFVRYRHATELEAPTRMEAVAALSGCPVDDLYLLTDTDDLQVLQPALRHLAQSTRTFNPAEACPRQLELHTGHRTLTLSTRKLLRTLRHTDLTAVYAPLAPDIARLAQYTDDEPHLPLLHNRYTEALTQLIYAYTQSRYKWLNIDTLRQCILQLPADQYLGMAMYLVRCSPEEWGK